jgi:hypothetical protein
MDSYPQVQTDITLTGGEFLSLPRMLPGRLNTEDFVFFHWPPHLNPKDYTVVISTNDTAGPIYRKISPLMNQVNLPFVQTDAYATIGVIPTTDGRKSQFWSRLNRGSTYGIPNVPLNTGMQYNMQRHGVLTSAVTSETYLA